MWKEIGAKSDHRAGTSMVFCNGLWIINTFDSIMALSEKAASLIWECKHGSHHTAYHQVLVIDGLVFFLDYPNDDKKTTVVRCLECQTGELVWEQNKKHSSIGCGLQTDGKWLIYSDYLSSDSKLDIIFAKLATGEVVHSFPINEIRISFGMLGQGIAKLTTVAGGHLYTCDKKKYQLYEAQINREVSNLSLRKDIINAEMVDSYGQCLFVALWGQENGEKVYFIVSLDASSGKEISRASYHRKYNLQNLTAVSETQVLLSFARGSSGNGIVLIDIGTGQVVWELGQEKGWNVERATPTPYGLFLSIHKIQDRHPRAITRVNPKTGELLPFYDLGDWPGFNVQWSGSTLIVDAGNSFRIYEWDEDGIDEWESYPKLVESEEKVVTSKQDIGVKIGADALVSLDASTPARTVDLQLQRVVNSFLDAMKNKADATTFDTKTREFQALAGAMFDKYPDTSATTIAAALVQLGVPQDVATNDVTILLYRDLSADTE